MKSAAGNPNGAMMGFMGMNMASGMNGGANLQGLYNQGAEKRSAGRTGKTDGCTGTVCTATDRKLDLQLWHFE